MTATVKDLGWQAYKRRAADLDGKSVKVGIFSGGRTDDDGTAVVDYAIFNEFGTRHIPARPFMRVTADKHRADVGKLAAGFGARVMAGSISPNGALGQIGQWFSDRIAATVRGSKGWAVPNSAATIRAKGSSTPLIDQGRLINAIRHEVQ